MNETGYTVRVRVCAIILLMVWKEKINSLCQRRKTETVKASTEKKSGYKKGMWKGKVKERGGTYN